MIRDGIEIDVPDARDLEEFSFPRRLIPWASSPR
jgi:hypothetical protein